jgi:hypothetical protein
MNNYPSSIHSPGRGAIGSYGKLAKTSAIGFFEKYLSVASRWCFTRIGRTIAAIDYNIVLYIAPACSLKSCGKMKCIKYIKDVQK